VSELDKPSSQSAANTNLVASNPEPKQLVAMVSTVKTEPVPAQPSSLQSANKEPAEPSTKAAVEPSPPPPTLVKQLTQPELLISNSLNAQEASPSQTTDPAVLKHLEHASEAINHGHLQTGLYYLRLAKKLGANLAPLQASAKQLIEQAQQNTATNEALSSQMQESIKLEFGLK
ncbi:MAG TPA: hypothetical protein PLM98_15645, partial [Thiolinea sp.]|nr:hypothetical protein [Thiolinea sp.]